MCDYEFQEHYNEKLKPVFDAQRGYFILTLYNLNYVEGQDGTQYDTQKTGEELTREAQSYVKEFDHGGMFSEIISGSFFA